MRLEELKRYQLRQCRRVVVMVVLLYGVSRSKHRSPTLIKRVTKSLENDSVSIGPVVHFCNEHDKVTKPQKTKNESAENWNGRLSWRRGFRNVDSLCESSHMHIHICMHWCHSFVRSLFRPIVGSFVLQLSAYAISPASSGEFAVNHPGKRRIIPSRYIDFRIYVHM